MSQLPRRSMVMAMDRNKLIGRAGGLPWRIPADFKHFVATTLNKAIIMGRRTFTDDIKRPLPKRSNIVVTRDQQWQFDGVQVAHSLQQAYALADELLPDVEEHCVIGGAQLCRDAMPLTERLYLTVVDAEFEGDTWFDSFEFSDWSIREQRALPACDEAPWDAVIYTLDRRGAR